MPLTAPYAAITPNETEMRTVSEITIETTQAFKFGPTFGAVNSMPHLLPSFAPAHPYIPYSACVFTVPALTVPTVSK
jgi:hypothetical protein